MKTRGRKDLVSAAEEHTVRAVRKEYEKRRNERMSIEAQWQLNACFVAGRQYAFVNPLQRIDEQSPAYAWEERQVYNHIAPVYESRLAKLDRVRPAMSVRPAGPSDEDLKIAKTSTKILTAVSAAIDLPLKLTQGTMWSELTGSVFYKLVWEGGESGGDAKVVVCPPYEIYPDSLSAPDIDSLRSLIHARAVPVDTVSQLYGVTVDSERVQIASVERSGLSPQPDLTVREPDGYVTLIEMYTAPTAEKPGGELLIVAGGRLLHSGPLPYAVGDGGRRVIPFVKQDSVSMPGSFFGTCMIDRAIPIQRAFNAVKNRKHEFMNRLAVGVLAVEDGAVDVDDLEADGLMPGKVLVYRQGATPPHMLDMGSVPNIFSTEEDRLLGEFTTVTGVSEMMRSSNIPGSVTSGTAIQLLIDQDDTRLTVTAELIRAAVRQLSRYIIRIYKQFARSSRLSAYAGEDGSVELLKWRGSDLSEGDIIFETENELNTTQATRQSMLFDLLRLGLFNGEDGRMSASVRHKILSAVGYGSWETMQDLENLHLLKADKENIAISGGESPEASEIDDHALHLSAHTRYMLSGDYERALAKSGGLEQRMLAHLRSHRTMQSLTAAAEAGGDEK